MLFCNIIPSNAAQTKKGLLTMRLELLVQQGTMIVASCCGVEGEKKSSPCSPLCEIICNGSPT